MVITLFILSLTSCYESEKTDVLKVVKVIDGDTIIVLDSTGTEVHVRLIGINSPESRDFKHIKKEPLGEEATEQAKNIMKDMRVYLEFDVEKQDKYGRALAYVYTEDGVFVNDSMLRSGYAELMTISPNVKHVDRFVASQAFAKAHEKGIWSIR